MVDLFRRRGYPDHYIIVLVACMFLTFEWSEKTNLTYLTQMTRKTGIKPTDDKISRIIRSEFLYFPPLKSNSRLYPSLALVTVQTGLVTALFALIDVIIFVTVTVSIHPRKMSNNINPSLFKNTTLLGISPRSRRQLLTSSYRNFIWDLALSKLYTNALLST